MKSLGELEIENDVKENQGRIKYSIIFAKYLKIWGEKLWIYKEKYKNTRW
jgi:hypothetical protein